MAIFSTMQRYGVIMLERRLAYFLERAVEREIRIDAEITVNVHHRVAFYGTENCADESIVTAHMATLSSSPSSSSC